MHGRELKQGMWRLVVSGLAAALLLAGALVPAAPQAAAAPQAPAAGPWAVGIVGHYGGAMFSVDSEIGSPLAYVGRGRRLQVYDVAFSNPPEMLGQSGILPDVAWDVDVVGNHAYVANGAGGLRVFDVTDYSQPVEVAAAALPREALKVVVANNRAYVATHSHLHIVNVADPTQPTLAGQLMLTNDGIQGLAVDGSMVYLTGGDALFLVDASNPAAPALVKTVTLLGDGRGVAVQGGYAYVASREDNLEVVDVAPAASASVVYSMNTGDTAEVVAVQGSYLFVGRLYGGVEIYSITTPAKPELATWLLSVPPHTNDIKAAGTRLYMANMAGGLAVISISVPSSPSLLATRTADVVLNVEVGQTFSGLTALLSNGNSGFKAIGVDDAAAPEEFDSFEAGNHYAAVKVGSVVYAAEGTHGLRALQAANPESISSLSLLDTDGQANDVAIKGEYAYVANGDSGLFIAKLTNPLTKTGSVDTPGFAHSVAVTGTHAYLASGDAGLHVISVQNPASPSLVATLPITGFAEHVAVQGQYAYVAAPNYGLVVVNISNPLAPTPVADYYPNVAPTFVTLHGSLALLANGDRGVTALDVSNPAQPALAGHFDTFNANAIKVYGEQIYVADGRGGLLILEPLDMAPRLFLPVLRR